MTKQPVVKAATAEVGSEMSDEELTAVSGGDNAFTLSKMKADLGVVVYNLGFKDLGVSIALSA